MWPSSVSHQTMSLQNLLSDSGTVKFTKHLSTTDFSQIHVKADYIDNIDIVVTDTVPKTCGEWV